MTLKYRVRIGGEVVAAAGPRAVRRVLIEREEKTPLLLEFTRAWIELDELPVPVREDTRLEIEQRRGEEDWHPLEGPVSLEAAEAEATPPEPEQTPKLDLADASYAQLQQAAKTLGLKAQGTKDELLDAVAAVLDGPELPEEIRNQALARFQ